MSLVMKFSSVLRALLTLLVAASVLLVPAAASAGTWSHTDPAGDVVKVDFSEDPEEDPESDPEGEEDEFDDLFTPDPAAKAGDIRRVVAAHRRTAFVVRFSMRAALPRTDWSVDYRILTRDRVYTLQLSRSEGIGTFRLVDNSGYQPRTVRCRGMQRTIDRTAATVRVVVPRSCLRLPSFVRFNVSTAIFTESDLRLDDGMVRGVSLFRSSFSPRIYKG